MLMLNIIFFYAIIPYPFLFNEVYLINFSHLPYENSFHALSEGDTNSIFNGIIKMIMFSDDSKYFISSISDRHITISEKDNIYFEYSLNSDKGVHFISVSLKTSGDDDNKLIQERKEIFKKLIDVKHLYKDFTPNHKSSDWELVSKKIISDVDDNENISTFKHTLNCVYITYYEDSSNIFSNIKFIFLSAYTDALFNICFDYADFLFLKNECPNLFKTIYWNRKEVKFEGISVLSHDMFEKNGKLKESSKANLKRSDNDIR